MSYQIKAVIFTVGEARWADPGETPDGWSVYEGEPGASQWRADCNTQKVAEALVRGLQWTKYAEAVADIAYVAGMNRYYSGDSRADIAEYIYAAHEFHSAFEAGVASGEFAEDDYMDKVLGYADAKFPAAEG